LVEKKCLHIVLHLIAENTVVHRTPDYTEVLDAKTAQPT